MEGDEPASMHPSFLRAYQLELNPIRGQFDADHLRRVHGHIFQDSPEFSPGVFRESKPEFPHYMKNRKLAACVTRHRVHYMPHDFAARVDQVLGELGGVEGLRGLPLEQAADRLATLYRDLDHAHSLVAGNSRSLRSLRSFTPHGWPGKPAIDWTGVPRRPTPLRATS